MSNKDDLARELFIVDNHMQPREQSIVDWEWFKETPRFAVRIERYTDTADRLTAAGIGDMAGAWDAGHAAGWDDRHDDWLSMFVPSGYSQTTTNPYRTVTAWKKEA